MSTNWAAEFNGDEDEDEALKRAIAMSLGEEVPRDSSPSDYDGGIDRDRVPDESQTQSSLASGVFDTKEKSEASTQMTNPELSQPPKNAFSALGLDRKQMEEERLARLQKRKAADADSTGDDRPTQRLKTSAGPPRTTSAPSIAQPHLATKDANINIAKSASSAEGKSTTASSKSLPFPRGVVKKTWALGHPRQDDDIKVEEVLQKDDLELAVLSSYQWDEDWLTSKLNLRKTKIVLIAFAADEATQAAMRANVPANIIRFCFPPMEGAERMHSKLQLLKYSNYLRIVVPTGNFMPYDWGETGAMENMVFLIDLPRIDDEAQRANNELTPFGNELCYFLKAQGLEEQMIKSLRDYDFSETSRYAFVHTIGGSHLSDWQRTGYCGLGRAISGLGLSTDEPPEIDYLCSSIGAINDGLLMALQNASKGDSGLEEYNSRTEKGKKTRNTDTSGKKGCEMRQQFRVYFPTHDTVTRSRGGKNAGGIITMTARSWKLSTFPREVFRDCKNIRPGLLIHSKVMFVRQRPSKSGETLGWAYVGSANLSESAWGRLVKDRATSKPKLNCRNWECGVVIPVPSPSAEGNQGLSEGEHLRMLDIFRGHIPIPIELPGVAYGSLGEQRPWLFNEG